MLLFSTGFKAAILGSSSFAAIFKGGEIRLFAGGRPASANDAEPGSPIGVITRISDISPGLQFAQANDYVIKPPSDRWVLTTMLAATPTWWRLIAAGDDATASVKAPRIDGDVGLNNALNDLTLQGSALASGVELSIDTFLFTFPPLGG